MATIVRLPLAARTQPPAPSPFSNNRSISSKRPRSPELGDLPMAAASAKRAKSTTPGRAQVEVSPRHEHGRQPGQVLTPTASKKAAEVSHPVRQQHHDEHGATREMSTKEREEKREKARQKAAREEEFRSKYTRAFPAWIFYFDTPEDALRDQLADGIVLLGGSVEEFFSRDVTHLIIAERDGSNKENIHRPSQSKKQGFALQSPIKLTQRGDPKLVKKAEAFGMKVWDTGKLTSVLSRCLALSTQPTVSHDPQADPRQLRRLLDNERLHGTTERDPTQKRHDYIYFNKNSYFVLVEDMHQELATIHAMEYPITRTEGGGETGDWPVLYLHPQSRGPFTPYDERAERKRERVEAAKREKEARRAILAKERERIALAQEKEVLMTQKKIEKWERLQYQKQLQQPYRKEPDLRRTVSMSNLHRAENLFDPEVEVVDSNSIVPSARASGYLASGANVAASGNSVGITSTTGTTSTAGLAMPRGAGGMKSVPPLLRGALEKHITMSRHPTPAVEDREQRERKAERKNGLMLPPPEPPRKMLRKSKSTNTMRLPKREEGSKPGYCESCRMRFDDFRQHVESKKHRKFAEESANFLELDCVLARVARRPKVDLEQDLEAVRDAVLDAFVASSQSSSPEVGLDDAHEEALAFQTTSDVEADAGVDEDATHAADVDEDVELDGDADIQLHEIQDDQIVDSNQRMIADDSYPIDLGSPLSELSDDDEDTQDIDRAMML